MIQPTNKHNAKDWRSIGSDGLMPASRVTLTEEQIALLTGVH